MTNKQTDHIEQLDLVIPCYNPNENWHHVFVSRGRELIALFDSIDIRFIFVDDGSTIHMSQAQKGVIQQAFPNCVFVSYLVNKGKGHAVRYGLSLASSEIVGYTDIDLPYLPLHVLEMYNNVESGAADIVLGYRDQTYYDKIPLLRRVISKSFRFILHHLLGIKLSDTQSGLKLFNRLGKKTLLKTEIETFLFDTEFMKLAFRDKLRIVSIPLKTHDGIEQPQLSFRIVFKELMNMVKIIIR